MTKLEIQLATLRGRTIVETLHLTEKSDADERVCLILDDGTRITFGTSEWLHVEINPEPELNTF